jgi:hypothetical protein
MKLQYLKHIGIAIMMLKEMQRNDKINIWKAVFKWPYLFNTIPISKSKMVKYTIPTNIMINT